MNNKQIDRLICLCKKDLNEITGEEIFELSFLRSKLRKDNLSKKQIGNIVTSCWNLSFEIISNEKVTTDNVVNIFLHVKNIANGEILLLCHKSMERSDRSDLARIFLKDEWASVFRKPETQNLLAENINAPNTG